MPKKKAVSEITDADVDTAVRRAYKSAYYSWVAKAINRFDAINGLNLDASSKKDLEKTFRDLVPNEKWPYTVMRTGTSYLDSCVIAMLVGFTAVQGRVLTPSEEKDCVEICLGKVRKAKTVTASKTAYLRRDIKEIITSPSFAKTLGRKLEPNEVSQAVSSLMRMYPDYKEIDTDLTGKTALNWKSSILAESLKKGRRLSTKEMLALKAKYYVKPESKARNRVVTEAYRMHRIGDAASQMRQTLKPRATKLRKPTDRAAIAAALAYLYATFDGQMLTPAEVKSKLGTISRFGPGKDPMVGITPFFLYRAYLTSKLERALTRDESFQAQNFVKDLQKGKHKAYSVLALISTGQAT